MTGTPELTATSTPGVSADVVPLPRAARYVMVASAVLAPALTAAGFLLDSDTIALSGRDLVAHLAEHLDDYAVQNLLGPVVAVLWVPAILAVGRVARAKAPALGLAGLILAFALALPLSLDPYELAYVGLRSGLDVDATHQLVIAAESVPAAVFGWGELLGLIGVIVLGIAILRGRSAPAWAGASLIAGALAIPVTWFSGLAVAAVVAWVLIGAGFAGTSFTLLKNGERR